ncbi:MAG: gamma-glutamylcyclotransferase family protein [Clostridium sp.]
MSKVNLAVYGTLKRNERADLSKMQGTKFIGCSSIYDYRMFLSNHGYPFIVKTDVINNCELPVEIFEIDEELLTVIDNYEGYNPENPENSLFKRIIFKDKCNGEDTYIYVLNENLKLPHIAELISFGKGVYDD